MAVGHNVNEKTVTKAEMAGIITLWMVGGDVGLMRLI